MQINKITRKICLCDLDIPHIFIYFPSPLTLTTLAVRMVVGRIFKRFGPRILFQRKYLKIDIKILYTRATFIESGIYSYGVYPQCLNYRVYYSGKSLSRSTCPGHYFFIRCQENMKISQHLNMN